MTVRVVSAPPSSNSRQSEMIWSSPNASPPTSPPVSDSTVTHLVITSSIGQPLAISDFLVS